MCWDPRGASTLAPPWHQSPTGSAFLPAMRPWDQAGLWGWIAGGMTPVIALECSWAPQEDTSFPTPLAMQPVSEVQEHSKVASTFTEICPTGYPTECEGSGPGVAKMFDFFNIAKLVTGPLLSDSPGHPQCIQHKQVWVMGVISMILENLNKSVK